MRTIAIITGASKGIGKGLSERVLKESDAEVWGISRSKGWEHERYKHFSWDLSKMPLEELENSFSDLIQQALSSDAEAIWLVNNAGLLGEIGPISRQQGSNIASVIQLNVTVPTVMMQLFLRHLRKFTGSKIILNISSGAGKYPVDGWGAYCASKAALDMFSLVAHEEEKIHQHGFQIFSVAPGVVDTDMQADIRKASSNDFSNIKKFLDYKEQNQLSKLEDVGEKLWKVLSSPDTFNEVLLDVRKF